MTSKSQRDRGYILPDQLTGHDLICLSMRIPDDEHYRAAVIGQVIDLTKWWTWEKSYQPGDTRASEAASYWLELVLAHLKIDDCDDNMGGTHAAETEANKRLCFAAATRW